MEGLGSLALLGSVGFGMAYSNLNDPNWSYEYKVGNDGHYVGGSGGGSADTATAAAAAAADLALLEESPRSIIEKVSGGPQLLSWTAYMTVLVVHKMYMLLTVHFGNWSMGNTNATHTG